MSEARHVHVFPVPKGMTAEEVLAEIRIFGSLQGPAGRDCAWSYTVCETSCSLPADATLWFKVRRAVERLLSLVPR